MPSVLIVDLGSVWGGQEIYSRSIASKLIDRGWSVTCLSPHERHAVPGVEFKRCQITYSNFPETRLQIRSLTERHDIVHFNGIRAIYLSALVNKSKPFVGSKHSPYESLDGQFLKSSLARLSRQIVFHNLDWLISISNKILDELPTRVRRRSSIVLNGVEDIGRTGTCVRNDDAFTLCFVGRFVEQKGLMRLLAAMRLLRCSGIHMRLLLAGGGPLEVEARSFVDHHGLAEVVSFLGYVESPGEVYRQSHVCVLPSQHEGLPLSLLEAMSAGCTLLGHDIPGVRDVIRHEGNGLLAEMSEASLAAALQRLVADRQLLARLRTAAREDYDHQWRIDRMVDETEAIYRRAIANSKVRG